MSTSETKPLPLTLAICEPQGGERLCRIAPGQGVFVGTSNDCEIRLAGASISPVHCRITYDLDAIRIHEWVSSQATTINGQPLEGVADVAPGDCIQIGSYRLGIAGSPQSEPDLPASESAAAAAATPRQQTPPGPALAEDSQPAATSDSMVAARPSDQPQWIDAEVDAAGDAPQQPGQPLPADPWFDQLGADPLAADVYDRQTVELLMAEIEDLRTALAQRDSSVAPQEAASRLDEPATDHGVPAAVQRRLQQLIDEADEADQRAASLENMLLAAESAQRAEQDQRLHLEVWVGEIERRVAQREAEYQAELETLRGRLDQASDEQQQLHRRLAQAAAGSQALQQYEETLNNLRDSHERLTEQLVAEQQRSRNLEQQVASVAQQQTEKLRAELADIARQRAELARQRYQISSRLAEVGALPKTENAAETETACRIQALREHLREIHQQEESQQEGATLATRLADLWNRVTH